MEVKSLTKNEILTLFPKREKEVNKGTFGKNVIFASCDEYVGAVKLSALGAISMRFGSGYTTLAVTKTVANSISQEIFECTLSIQDEIDGHFAFNEEKVNEAIKNAKSVCVGMGMKKNEQTRKLVLYLLKNFNGVLIIDADGLNSIKIEDLNFDKKPKVIITPHPTEFSRFTGVSKEEIIKNPIEIAKKYAERLGVIILLKGSESVITDGKQVYQVKESSSSLAKAGSGDFLSGAISSLSLNMEPLLASYVAAQIIASAAKSFSEKYNDNVMLVRDLPNEILRYFKKII